jgi:hypothetical protein
MKQGVAKSLTRSVRGINPQDVTVRLVQAENYNSVQFTITTTGETLTYNNTPSWQNGYAHAPANFVFADGTQWDMNEAVRQTPWVLKCRARRQSFLRLKSVACPRRMCANGYRKRRNFRSSCANAGMQIVAEIHQGKRTVLEYLLSPVTKAVQEAGREK